MLVLVASLPISSPRVRADAENTSGGRTGPISVLFIGNSYTRSNNLPYMVRRIAEMVPNAPPFRVAAVANPGWDLGRHWSVDETRALIASGGFTHVVLQGHSLSALQTREEFEDHARLFDAAIDGIGARTVLYETWARRGGSSAYRRAHIAASPVDMQARVTECYSALARALDADLAPAGRAFLMAQSRIPEAQLYRSDGAHPSQDGTYLAAAVLYATIARDDPRRTSWFPYGTPRQVAAELRDVAFRAVTAR